MACSNAPSSSEHSASDMAHPDDPTKNSVGLNMYATLDWARNRPFTDMMKTARFFSSATSDGTRAPVDANGWPTTDAAVIVFADLPRNHGTYALSFIGRATVEVRGAGVLSNVVYDSATNRTTGRLVIGDPNSTFLALVFRNTTGGVRNIKLMRPVTPGATTSYPETQVFTDPFLGLIRSTVAIRSMDWTATNGNSQVSWSDRVLPSYASGNRQVSGYGWQGRGIAWEYVILLANAAGKDVWIDVPGEANEDYVRQLARLFRDGSTVDGVTYPGLRPDLHLYVENSNELWNFHGDFTQSPRNRDAAVREVAAGGSPLSFDGVTDQYQLAWRRAAYRGARISLIFREVFGDAAMMTRVRPVFAWQQNDGQGTATEGLYFLDRYFGEVRPGNPVARPVSYFFWGAGGSAYYNPDNASTSLTLDNIWTSRTFGMAEWERVLRRDAFLTVAYGLRRVAYEGGPSMDTNASLATKQAANEDPRMTDLIVQHHEMWSRYNGDLLMYYCDADRTHEWAYTSDSQFLDTAKLRALQRIATSPRVAPTIGRVPPTQFRGGDFDTASPGWLAAGSPSARLDLGQRGWALYTLRVTVPTTIQVAVTTAYGTADAQAQVRVDGVNVTTLDVSGSAARTQTVTQTVTVAPGVHGLVVRSSRGAFDVQNVNVTVVATPAPAPAPTPTPTSDAGVPTDPVVTTDAGTSTTSDAGTTTTSDGGTRTRRRPRGPRIY